MFESLNLVKRWLLAPLLWGVSLSSGAGAFMTRTPRVTSSFLQTGDLLQTGLIALALATFLAALLCGGPSTALTEN